MANTNELAELADLVRRYKARQRQENSQTGGDVFRELLAEQDRRAWSNVIGSEEDHATALERHEKEGRKLAANVLRSRAVENGGLSDEDAAKLKALTDQIAEDDAGRGEDLAL